MDFENTTNWKITHIKAPLERMGGEKWCQNYSIQIKFKTLKAHICSE
jgi:hypothetical protein